MTATPESLRLPFTIARFPKRETLDEIQNGIRCAHRVFDFGFRFALFASLRMFIMEYGIEGNLLNRSKTGQNVKTV